MFKQIFRIVVGCFFMTTLAADTYSEPYLEPYYDRDTKTFAHFEGEKKEVLESNETYAVNGFYKWFYPVPHLAWESLFNFAQTKCKAPEQYYSPEDPISNWVVDEKPVEKSMKPVITWIGHATFLIQVRNLNIITDPVFGDLSSLYPRNVPPGISPEKLPKIDVILISHCHRDHFDKASLDFLIKRDNPLVYLPKKTVRTFRTCSLQDALVLQCMPYFNMKNVTQFSWWESHTEIKEKVSVSVTFMPSHHWSGFSLLDANRSLWGGWSIIVKDLETKKSVCIYFAGDTAYKKPLFEKIKEYFISKKVELDVALLPIGPNEPRDLLQEYHMSTQEAVDAFVLLGAKKFIPMHFGTFRLGIDDIETPIKILTKSLSEKNLKSCLVLPKFGQRIAI